MSKKSRLVLLFLPLAVAVLIKPDCAPPAHADSDFVVSSDKTYQVFGFGESQRILLPEEPFDTETEIRWEAGLEQKSSRGKNEAFVNLSYVFPNGERKEIVRLTQGQTRSGTVRLPKGYKLLLELYAGEYQSLISRSGAKAFCRVKYPELTVKAVENSELYSFKFQANGFENIDRWVWNFSDGTEAEGKNIDHTFPTCGSYRVFLRGYRGSEMVQSVQYDFTVPDFAEIRPELSPLEGAVEFNVAGQAKLKSHYRQSPVCVWDFGDGTPPTEGESVTHVYKKVGRFIVTLTVHSPVFGQNLTRTWEVAAKPGYVLSRATVTPQIGVVPLKVSFNSNVTMEGSPISLKYNWDFGDGQQSDRPDGDHTYARPGNYLVTLKIWDEKRPEIALPVQKFPVQALPPIVRVNPAAYPEQGTVPLKVAFKPNLWVEGAPTDITFSWDFGDGAVSNLPEPEHTYAKPGKYNVVLSVKENIHRINVSAFLRVTALPPRIEAAGKVSPNSGVAPLKVVCTADPQVEGSPVDLQIFWDFGDGEVAAGRQVTHVYKQPGRYTVKLTVRDNIPEHGGTTAEATFTVNVKAGS